MIDVVAVEETNVFVCYQNVLIADLARVWHLLNVVLVKLVLESGEAVCLNGNFFYLWFCVLDQENQNVLTFEV